MKDNTLYMFIDEGGNFDFSPKGTKYFTLSCLTEKRSYEVIKKAVDAEYDVFRDGNTIYYDYKE